MMKKSLQKTIAAAFALALPLAASADWKTVYTEDFEDSETYSTNLSAGNATMSQGTRTDGTYYAHFYNGGSGTRYPAYDAPDDDLSVYLSATQWQVSLDFGCTYSSQGQEFYFQSGSVAGGDTVTIFSIRTTGTSTSATMYDASGNSLGTLDIDAYTWGASGTISTWYTITFTGSEDGVTVSIADASGNSILDKTTTSSSSTPFEQIYSVMNRYYGNVGFDEIKFYTYSDEEVVETPTVEITKVDGTEREVTMECETDSVTIYYTANGGDTQTYSEPVTVSETTTFVVWAESASGTKSEELTDTVEAGVEVSLADITYSVTGMTEVSGLYYPTYAFSIDNSDVLLTPEATLSATIDGESVELTDGAYAFTSTATIIVTASAEGYASSTNTIEVVEYTLSQEPSVDYNEINSGNIDEVLGSDWSIDDSSTRWANWSKTAGVNADGESNSGADYYVASTTSTSVDFEFVTLENAGGVNLLIGYGFGGTRENYISIIADSIVDNAIAEYDRCGYGTSYDTVYVTTAESSTLQYTITAYSYTITSAKLYIPYSDTDDAISEVSAEVESDDATSAPVYSLSGVMVREAGEGVSGLSKGIYIMDGKKVMIK